MCRSYRTLGRAEIIEGTPAGVVVSCSCNGKVARAGISSSRDAHAGGRIFNASCHRYPV